MTAFSTTDIPANVNTVEKLAVWSAQVLSFLYPDKTALEATGTAERVAQSTVFEVIAESPSQWRHGSRISVALNRNWMKGNGDIWEHVIDIGSSAIPTEFKA